MEKTTGFGSNTLPVKGILFLTIILAGWLVSCSKDESADLKSSVSSYEQPLVKTWYLKKEREIFLGSDTVYTKFPNGAYLIMSPDLHAGAGSSYPSLGISYPPNAKMGKDKFSVFGGPNSNRGMVSVDISWCADSNTIVISSKRSYYYKVSHDVLTLVAKEDSASSARDTLWFE